MNPAGDRVTAAPREAAAPRTLVLVQASAGRARPAQQQKLVTGKDIENHHGYWVNAGFRLFRFTSFGGKADIPSTRRRAGRDLTDFRVFSGQLV